MIVHAFNPTIPTGSPLTWWAIHAESLTPVRITVAPACKVHLEIVAPLETAVPVFQSHPEADADPRTIAAEVIGEIRTAFHPTAKLSGTTLISREESELPEYLIIVDANGEHPAVFRSTEPTLIIPADPNDETTLAQPTHWKAYVDLPATGWEYFWTDCQQALEELTPAFLGENK